MKNIKKDDSGIDYAEKVDDILSVESRERIFQEFIISPFIQSICKDKDVVPVDIKVSGKSHKYEFYCGKYGYLWNKALNITFETPDLCVANKWKWLNHDCKKENYIFTVEVKTVYSDDVYWISPGFIDNQMVYEKNVKDIIDFVNEKMLIKNTTGDYRYEDDSVRTKSIEKQIGIHLRGINKLIVTDGVRWIFFYKKNEKCYALPPIDLGKRICKKARKYYSYVRIDWNFKDIVIKGKYLGKRLGNFELLKDVIYNFCESDVPNMDKLAENIKRRIEV